MHATKTESDGAGAEPSEAPEIQRRLLAALAAGATDIGQRTHNEDHVLLRPELGLFLLADGAGGHNAGNVASALATSTVANVFETSAAALADRPEVDPFGMWTIARRLSAAIHRANADIIDIAKGAAKYQGMGTTIVALAVSPEGDHVHVAHVGDSRCYRWRAGHLEALTVDHSLMTDVLEAQPDADDALLARAPQHVVTRALGMEERLRVPVRTLRALAGDLYLMCSDGLTEALDDLTIEAALSEHATPDDLVRSLVQQALAAGAQDNVGVVVIALREADVPSARRPTLKPPPPPAPPPPIRAPFGSAPEIIIVGVETRVVPTESADARLLDAVAGLTRLRAASAPELARPKPAQCSACGQPLESQAVKCPTCDAPVT
jgi:PPM family protein phosphatase